MDNLTHSLAGVALARCGFHRLTPRATAICVVAANIPDIDVLSATSAINYLNYHRHLTHSLLAVPVMAFVALFLAEFPRWLFRPQAQPLRWKGAWWTAFAAALSHPLLDLCNTYGVRLWLPFSGRWHSWNALFIVDLWVWAMLLAAILAPGAARWAGWQEPRRALFRRNAAWTGLALLIGYILVKGVLHDRAVAALQAAHGEGAVRIAAFPSPHSYNPYLWMGFVEKEGYYLAPHFDLRKGLHNPGSEARYDKPQNQRALQAALSSAVGKDFARFAQYLYAEVEEVSGGYIVRLTDFRFRRPGQIGFVCTIEMDEQYRIERQDFRF